MNINKIEPSSSPIAKNGPKKMGLKVENEKKKKIICFGQLIKKDENN